MLDAIEPTAEEGDVPYPLDEWRSCLPSGIQAFGRHAALLHLSAAFRRSYPIFDGICSLLARLVRIGVKCLALGVGRRIESKPDRIGEFQ